MNHQFAVVLLGSVLLLAPAGSLLTGIALAQTATVTPAPDPATGAAPAKPTDAQETYDEVAIQQIMKVVELSRTVAGGIAQLFGSAESQRQLLDLIRAAQTGPREFPLLNDPADVEARDGGEGLREMGDGALNGNVEGPPDLVDAFNKFRTTFSLDKALALKDDELLSKKMLAQLAARGVIGGAVAENSYKRANASMTRMNEYITALEASADLKTSIDINTRAVIELTQQTNEGIRTQAAVTSIVSAYFMALASEASATDWLEGLKQFNR